MTGWGPHPQPCVAHGSGTVGILAVGTGKGHSTVLTELKTRPKGDILDRGVLNSTEEQHWDSTASAR